MIRTITRSGGSVAAALLLTVLPLSARDQHQWDAYRRRCTPWLVEDKARR